MISERRQSRRQRSFLGGRICFSQRRATLDCVVRNVSENGALLEVSDAVAVPAAFDLEIDHRRRSYNAHVRWRDGGRIGVTFQPAGVETEVVPLDLMRRLRQCEQEKLALQNRVAQLSEPG